MQLSQTLQVLSDVSGSIVKLNATPGQSTNSSDALFVIQEKGSLWLESDLDTTITKHLNADDVIQVKLNGHKFDATVLQISPFINAMNQTKHIRLSLPTDIGLSTGLQTTASFTIPKHSFIVSKKSVIKHQENQIVFIKTQQGYRAVQVTILAEDASFYYLQESDMLQYAIAIDSLAVLKNMLGEDNE